MQLLRGPYEKGQFGTLPDGIKLYTLFKEEVTSATFDVADLRALGKAMMQLSNRGSSALAGYTYLGQFLAHDMSRLRIEGHNQTVKPFTMDVIRSDVSAVLDLSSVYDGAGPGSKMRVENSALMAIGAAQKIDGLLLCGYDLPRDEAGKAFIGDERNDENLIVAQLHVQFLRLHNFFVEKIGAEQPHLDIDALFLAAKEQVVLHYQEVILYDFLYEIIHPSVWKAIILDDKSILWKPKPDDPAVLPIEYAAAAGRFGHAMIRDKYDINRLEDPNIDQLFLMTWSGRFGGNLNRLPAASLIDWLLFFDFPLVTRRADPKRNPSLRISPRVTVDLRSTDLRSEPEETNLATRNLLRGSQMRLGSGQTVADFVIRHFHGELADCNIPIRQLTMDELNLNKPGDQQNAFKCSPALCTNTPLWFYLLAESYVTETSEGIGKLGPLGSLIVAESIKGLLKLDKSSLFYRQRRRADIAPSKKIRSETDRCFLQMSDLILATNPGLPDPTML